MTSSMLPPKLLFMHISSCHDHKNRVLLPSVSTLYTITPPAISQLAPLAVLWTSPSSGVSFELARVENIRPGYADQCGY